MAFITFSPAGEVLRAAYISAIMRQTLCSSPQRDGTRREIEAEEEGKSEKC